VQSGPSVEETYSSHFAAPVVVVVEVGYLGRFSRSPGLPASQGDVVQAENEGLQVLANTQARVEAAIHIPQKGEDGSHEVQVACEVA